jgi:hypothetical protein
MLEFPHDSVGEVDVPEGEGGHSMEAHADADVLSHASEIRSDKGRHAKALAALQYKAQKHSAAAEHEGGEEGDEDGGQSFHEYVKKGMKKAFNAPAADGEPEKEAVEAAAKGEESDEDTEARKTPTEDTLNLEEKDDNEQKKKKARKGKNGQIGQH